MTPASASVETGAATTVLGKRSSFEAAQQHQQCLNNSDANATLSAAEGQTESGESSSTASAAASSESHDSKRRKTLETADVAAAATAAAASSTDAASAHAPVATASAAPTAAAPVASVRPRASISGIKGRPSLVAVPAAAKEKENSHPRRSVLTVASVSVSKPSAAAAAAVVVRAPFAERRGHANAIVAPASSSSTASSATGSSAAQDDGRKRTHLQLRGATAAAKEMLEEMDDLAAMLAQHNKKVQPVGVYVPPMHSVKEIRQWEKETGFKWHDLSSMQRQEANEAIATKKAQEQECAV